jgi:hypothetical protein
MASQAPRRYRRRLMRSSRATETRLGAGALGVKGEVRVSASREHQADRFQRLEVAEQAVRRSGEVGKLEDGKNWIDDELTMYWGFVYASANDPSPGPLAVLLLGERDNHVLALHGSAHHVVGVNPAYVGRIHGASNISLWESAWQRFATRGSTRGLDYLARLRYLKDALSLSATGSQPSAPDPFERVLGELSNPSWLPQKVHFLANRLMERDNVAPFWWDWPAVHVTIGTPLYVEVTGPAEKTIPRWERARPPV